MNGFKSIPTFEDVVRQVALLKAAVKTFSDQFIARLAHVENSIQENNALTDECLQEMNLQVAFLMSHIRVVRPLNSGIVGVDGKANYEQIPAMQAFLDMRPLLIAQRDERLKEIAHAQGLQAETPRASESDPEADEARDAIETKH